MPITRRAEFHLNGARRWINARAKAKPIMRNKGASEWRIRAASANAELATKNQKVDRLLYARAKQSKAIITNRNVSPRSIYTRLDQYHRGTMPRKTNPRYVGALGRITRMRCARLTMS